MRMMRSWDNGIVDVIVRVVLHICWEEQLASNNELEYR